jgi:hypothetical protein
VYIEGFLPQEVQEKAKRDQKTRVYNNNRGARHGKGSGTLFFSLSLAASRRNVSPKLLRICSGRCSEVSYRVNLNSFWFTLSWYRE